MTISKIRFLESQGLVDPERTPSGYRKFYDQDVERLRWILRQQREHFLPLKVIRGRLSEHPEGAAENGAATETALHEPDTGDAAEGSAAPAPAPAPPKEPTPGGTSPRQHRSDPAGQQVPAPRATGREGRGASPAGRQQPPTLPGIGEAHEPGPSGTRQTTRSKSDDAAPVGSESDSFTAEELAAAAGTTPGLVNELKQYGLISVHAVVAGTAYFDRSALEVTKAAAGFALHGVEARHLRAWRNSADREAALFEQLVMPLLRQRNPQARRQAADTVSNLARLGGDLRSALLEKALREIR